MPLEKTQEPFANHESDAHTTMVARRPEASRERGYTNDELQECVDMVLKENMTQAKARAAMNAKGVVIPKGTLHGYVCDVRKTHGMVKKKLTVGTRLGPPTLLTKSQEQRLYNSIFEHDLAGEPMTKERVKEVAWVLSEIDHLVWKCNPLPNQGLCTGQLFGPSGPSDKWFRSFAKRWKLNAEPWNVRRRGSTLISRTRR